MVRQRGELGLAVAVILLGLTGFSTAFAAGIIDETAYTSLVVLSIVTSLSRDVEHALLGIGEKDLEIGAVFVSTNRDLRAHADEGSELGLVTNDLGVQLDRRRRRNGIREPRHVRRAAHVFEVA